MFNIKEKIADILDIFVLSGNLLNEIKNTAQGLVNHFILSNGIEVQYMADNKTKQKLL